MRRFKKSQPKPDPVISAPRIPPPGSPPHSVASSAASVQMDRPLGNSQPPGYHPSSVQQPMGPPPVPQNSQYPANGPPIYGNLQQMNMNSMIPTTLSNATYPGRSPAAEVEGAGRSKVQLIVGIDFGTTFSGVAYAFATNNEAREDIITEWPGAGTHTKQKVSPPGTLIRGYDLTGGSWFLLDSHGSLLRSVPKGCRMGPRHR